jgi:lipoprotein-anchoring transpeptidase ErfK/SrfK
MRRLVGISSKTKKAIMAVMALALSPTSIHMAAAARIASLRRQQEQIEKTALKIQPSAMSVQPSAQTFFSNTMQPTSQKQNNEISSKEKNSGQMVPAVKPANPTGAHKRRIIISIADRKLALMEDGQVLKTYPIAVGTRHTPSPDGDFAIINHAKDPVYRHGDKEVPPGKDNPLGTRWMGLSLKGYGIHGTNVQGSVGKAASHGCFRMRKQDVEELYTLVQVGDQVTVRRERDSMTAQLFAEPANAPAVTLAKSEASAETQVAAATVTTAETTEQ